MYVHLGGKGLDDRSCNAAGGYNGVGGGSSLISGGTTQSGVRSGHGQVSIAW